MNENFKFLFSKKNLIFFTFLERVIFFLLFLFIFFNSYQEHKRYSNEVSALTITPNVTVVKIAAPTILSATATSSSQIDIVWSSVSDADYYKVYRDGGFIASTTLTSYSDTGLSPATTYTYTVSAFSETFGESSQSSPVQATTLAEEAAARKGGLILIPPQNISLIINNGDIYTNSKKVNLKLFAQGASEMAISNNLDFKEIIWEKYRISKDWILEEGDGFKTVYAKFKSSAGVVSQTISDSIILDTIAPLNISDFEAIAGDKQIFLKWKNPLDEDFKGVKIMASTDFYPSSPSEGTPVYEGKGTELLIIGLTNGIRYYYTVFSYDQAGNFSSGAVVSAIPFKEEIPPPPPPPPPPPLLPPEIEKLTFQDFDFQQEGKKISPETIEDKIKIKAKTDEPLTISLDYEKVPEVLKTLMVTLEKEGKSFSFLLRINPQMTKYEAILLVPQEPGIYNLTFDILDYKNQTLKKISGYLEIEGKEPFLPPEVLVPWYKNLKIWFLVLLLIILMIIIIYWIGKRKKKQLEKNHRNHIV